MLLRKLIRTIGKYKAQFFSMILMVALGAGVFLGFNIEWYSIETNVENFLEETGFADYRIVSSDGFTEADLEQITQIDGVDAAARYFSVNADLSGSENLMGVCVTTDPEVSGFVVMQGEEYDANSEDGFWLFDQYAQQNGIRIGDSLTLTYENVTFEGVVKGLIEAGEQMICLQDETQIMPDFSKYGYIYTTPRLLKKVLTETLTQKYGIEPDQTAVEAAFDGIMMQIHVISDLSKTEFTAGVEEKLGRTTLILTKDETASYSGAMGEAEEGKTMASILPVLFFAIAILTMITTMQRIAANEKIQIGTLKALGIKDYRIIRHYASFAAMIGIAGMGLGILLGYGIGYYIMNPNGMMATYIVMPDWRLVMPWWCLPVLAAVLVLLVLIGYISVRQMLRGTAADTLRPYVPKKMKRTAVEKTRLWEKTGFAARWNLRDAMRHKSRSIVTFIGILGCMVLIVAGMGMYDTMNHYLDVFYNDAMQYESRIYLSDSADRDAAVKTAEEYEGDYGATVSVELGDKAVSLEIYHVAYGLIRFLDKNSRAVTLPEDGALVCMRLTEEWNLKTGDVITVSPYGTDENYEIRVAGTVRSMTESIVISETYAKTLFSGTQGICLTDSAAYKIDSVYTMTVKSDISGDSVASVQSKSELESTFDSFMEMLYESIAILILAAVILSVVVLYNLGVMSYTERYRELATLKVIGFKNKKISGILISQNVWITVAGIAFGIPAGIGVLAWMLKALASEYEMMVSPGVLTYTAGAVITFSVSMLVSLLIAKKNKYIDMVEALKGVD